MYATCATAASPYARCVWRSTAVCPVVDMSKSPALSACFDATTLGGDAPVRTAYRRAHSQRCVNHRSAGDRFMRVTPILVAAIAATFVGAAQGGEDSSQNSGPVVLKAAYLFDSKSGQLTQGGTLLVEGGKIVAVGGMAPA